MLKAINHRQPSFLWRRPRDLSGARRRGRSPAWAAAGRRRRRRRRWKRTQSSRRPSRTGGGLGGTETPRPRRRTSARWPSARRPRSRQPPTFSVSVKIKSSLHRKIIKSRKKWKVWQFFFFNERVPVKFWLKFLSTGFNNLLPSWGHSTIGRSLTRLRSCQNEMFRKFRWVAFSGGYLKNFGSGKIPTLALLQHWNGLVIYKPHIFNFMIVWWVNCSSGLPVNDGSFIILAP